MLSEKIKLAVETALGEFESIGPDFVRIGKDLLNYFLSFAFLSDPIPLKVQKLVEFMDRFLDVLGGLAVRIPALIVSKVIISELKVPTTLAHRVMRLDDVSRFPIEVMMEHGIRQVVGGSMPNTLSIAERMNSLQKKITAIIARSIPKLFRALLGGMFSRILKLIFLVLQIVQAWALVLAIWSYAKAMEEEGENATIFAKKLSQSAARKKVKVRISRRMGGVKP